MQLNAAEWHWWVRWLHLRTFCQDSSIPPFARRPRFWLYPRQTEHQPAVKTRVGRRRTSHQYALSKHLRSSTFHQNLHPPYHPKSQPHRIRPKPLHCLPQLQVISFTLWHLSPVQHDVSVGAHAQRFVFREDEFFAGWTRIKTVILVPENVGLWLFKREEGKGPLQKMYSRFRPSFGQVWCLVL